MPPGLPHLRPAQRPEREGGRFRAWVLGWGLGFWVFGLGFRGLGWGSQEVETSGFECLNLGRLIGYSVGLGCRTSTLGLGIL